MTERRQGFALVWLALAARLLFLFFSRIPPYAMSCGDAAWYFATSFDLVRASESGPLQPGPLYLLFLGLCSAPFSHSFVPIILVKCLQVVLSALTVGLVYLLGRRVWGHRVGMVAGGALALGPAFIIDAAQIVTEPLFMFLLISALTYYLWRVDGKSCGVDGPRLREVAVVGLLMGLAALTRAAVLVFPAALVLHLALRWGWRRALKPAGVLLLVFALTLSPWTVYNLVKWNRFVIAGEGFAGFLFFGAQDEGWTGGYEWDAEAGIEPGEDRDFAGRAAATISADPVGWATLRLRNLTDATLQPHHTAYYGGESLKDAAARWLTQDRTLAGLTTLAQSASFWPKLVLYLFHFTALFGGLVGMALSWRRWRGAFVLYALAGYYLGVHLVIYAIPRYLFPAEPVWWLFAASAIVFTWDAIFGKIQLRRATARAGNDLPADDVQAA